METISVLRLENLESEMRGLEHRNDIAALLDCQSKVGVSGCIYTSVIPRRQYAAVGGSR
jgi:hypothetical protein